MNQELLEYISFRERNSFNFLCLYIEKVLKDSGLYRIFEYFFRLQDKNSFRELKDAYTQFTINYTPINGATECGRIFTKVLNPLACKYRKCGTERGHISKDIITQDMIMYNQRNWRDILSEKPKDMTRIEYEITLPKPSEDCMTTYRINRAKRICVDLMISIEMERRKFMMKGISRIQLHRCIIYFRQVIILQLQTIWRT